MTEQEADIWEAEIDALEAELEAVAAQLETLLEEMVVQLGDWKYWEENLLAWISQIQAFEDQTHELEGKIKALLQNYDDTSPNRNLNLFSMIVKISDKLGQMKEIYDSESGSH